MESGCKDDSPECSCPCGCGCQNDINGRDLPFYDKTCDNTIPVGGVGICSSCTDGKHESPNDGKLPACGDKECGVSQNICDQLTFGKGELDNNGWWEIPCPVCARAFEKLCPEYAPCWPEPEKDV